MKEPENNVTIMYPSSGVIDCRHSENNLKSSEKFINSPFHEKRSILSSFETSLKPFWFSYFCILLINLINLILSYCSSKEVFLYYVYVGSLAVLIIAVIFPYRVPTKKRMICLYVITCIHMILTDPTIYSIFISYNPSPVSAFELLIPTALIFSNILNRTI